MTQQEQVTDEQLLRRYADGHATAFEQLYRRHRLPVWHFIYRYVGNRATADELMQEVWFSVANQAARYKPGARFTTWLFTIARNRSLNVVMRAPPIEKAEIGHLPSEADPQRELEEQQEYARYIAAIAALPVEQREAVLLQVDGAMSVADIAVATAVSFETAKSRLRYARTALRQLSREFA